MTILEKLAIIGDEGLTIMYDSGKITDHELQNFIGEKCIRKIKEERKNTNGQRTGTVFKTPPGRDRGDV